MEYLTYYFLVCFLVGQSAYKRLSRQINKMNAAIVKGVKLYNQSSEDLSDVPSEISLSAAYNPSGEIYQCLSSISKQVMHVNW